MPKRFNGLGVLHAVANVNGPLRAFVLGQDPINQQDIDRGMIALDGTENKAKFGTNAILGVSMAVLKAGALASQLPLYRYVKERYDQKRPYLMPIPFLNILNGGAHAENSSDFQEYKIAALGAPNFREAFRWSSEVFHALKTLLHERHLPTTVGDEGGFAPALGSNQEYVEMILRAIENAGYQPGKDFYLALDPAINACFEGGMYHLKRDGKVLSSTEMIDYWEAWVTKYPIISLEGGLAEDDWESWKQRAL